MSGGWRRLLATVAALCVAVVGCGDGDEPSEGVDDGGGSADVVSAVLGIITTNIDTDTGDGFVDAVEGEELTVGDRVKTDATGFAEVTYHDGSWMRVESEATLTIEDLADTESGQVVSTSIDTGEAWNRVAELSEPEDEYIVDTPVASAAVRGTAFAIDCDGDVACTFSVVEGEVLVTPDTGDPVTLTAGQSLTVTAGEEPPAPTEPGVEALSEQPFIAENLELDETKAAETNGEGGDQGPGEETGGAEDETAAGGLDPGDIDPCTLLTEEQALALFNANSDILGFAGQGPGTGVAAVVDQGNGLCSYEINQGEVPFPLPLEVGVILAGDEDCLVEGDGVCMYAAMRGLTVPDDVAAAVRARLSGSSSTGGITAGEATPNTDPLPSSPSRG